MRLAAIAIWLAMIWPAAALADAPPPAAYTPREHDFTVMFPAEPKFSLRLVKGGDERAYMDNEGEQLFMVTVANVFRGDETDEGAYARRLQRFAAGGGLNMTSSRNLMWGGGPACEGVFTNGRGVVIVVRMLVHDKRLYQAVHQGRNTDDDEAAGFRFLDSFELTDR